ncbi:MAG: 50S ribosomal protein L24 [Gammaproteobacteria bacterium]
MKRIRAGDEVMVTSGKDKGRQGTVVKVLSKDRVVVENINMVKKHQKPNPNQGIAGGIIEKEMPMHASNVMLYNPVTKKGDRVGIKTLEDGEKKRYFKSTQEVVDI